MEYSKDKAPVLEEILEWYNLKQAIRYIFKKHKIRKSEIKFIFEQIKIGNLAPKYKLYRSHYFKIFNSEKYRGYFSEVILPTQKLSSGEAIDLTLLGKNEPLYKMFGDFQIEGGITIEPTLLEDNCKFVVTFCFNSGVYDISLESSEIEGLFTKIQNEKIRIEFPIPSLEGAGHPLAFHEDLSRWENLDDSDYSSINEHTIFMLLNQSIRPEYDDYSDGGFICTVGYLNFDLIKDGEVGFTKIDLNEFIAKTFQPPTFNTTHIINSKNNHTSSNQSGNNARFYQIIYALCVLLSIDDGNLNDTLKLSHLPRSMFKKRGVKVSHRSSTSHPCALGDS